MQLAEIPSGGRVLAHLVNYVLAADGTVTPSTPFALAVKLNGPKLPTKASIASPEAGKEIKPLALKIEDREGAKYAVVPVPAVRVYAVIAIE